MQPDQTRTRVNVIGRRILRSSARTQRVMVLLAFQLVACDSDHRAQRDPADDEGVDSEVVEQIDAAAPLASDAEIAAEGAVDAEQPAPSFPDEAPLYRSGTRLRARLLVSEVGAPWFVGWYDSELKEDCSFTRNGGFGSYERWTCLPGAVAEVACYNDHCFLDAECMTPVTMLVEGSPCAPSSRYQRLSWSQDVYEVDAQLDGRNEVYERVYQNAVSTCLPKAVSAFSASFPRLPRHIVAEPVSLSRFVGAGERIPAGGDSSRTVVEGEDGVIHTTGLFSPSSISACAWQNARGAAVNPQEADEYLCQSVPPNTVRARLHRTGNERLQRQELRTESGYLLAVLNFFDRELQVPCEPVDTSSGFRCLPPGSHNVHIESGFEDAACTVPAVFVREESPMAYALRSKLDSELCSKLDYKLLAKSASPRTFYAHSSAQRRCEATSGYALLQLSKERAVSFSLVTE
jgi:hypothetical protein